VALAGSYGNHTADQPQSGDLVYALRTTKGWSSGFAREPEDQEISTLFFLIALIVITAVVQRF